MRIKNLLLVIGLGFAIYAGFAIFGPSDSALACGQKASSFFGLKDWHFYLPCDDSGGIDNSDFKLNQVWLIAIAVLESLIRAAGLVAVVFVVWGGVKYITSQGSPDGTASARRTIINALAGVVIAMSASVMVSFVIDLLTNNAGVTSGSGVVNVPNANASGVTVARVFKAVYAIVSAVAVAYVVVGSIKFSTSTGDPSKANSARNMIIYALVGLVVVLVANLITSAVIGELGLGGARFVVDQWSILI